MNSNIILFNVCILIKEALQIRVISISSSIICHNKKCLECNSLETYVRMPSIYDLGITLYGKHVMLAINVIRIWFAFPSTMVENVPSGSQVCGE